MIKPISSQFFLYSTRSLRSMLVELIQGCLVRNGKFRMRRGLPVGWLVGWLVVAWWILKGFALKLITRRAVVNVRRSELEAGGHSTRGRRRLGLAGGSKTGSVQGCFARRFSLSDQLPRVLPRHTIPGGSHLFIQRLT